MEGERPSGHGVLAMHALTATLSVLTFLPGFGGPPWLPPPPPPPVSSGPVTVCASGCDFTELGDAVDASSAGDVIELGNGTHEGGIVIGHDLTIRPKNAWGRPTIEGGDLNNVIRIKDDADVTLERLEITGGEVKSGIKNLGSLLLDDVYVLGNAATYGGLWNYGTVSITGNSVFADNESTSFFAGALNNFAGDATIEQTTFIDNAGHNGGAISNLSGTMSIEATSMSYNSAYLGGAVHNSFGDLDISASSFTGNFAESIGGGWSNHNVGGTVTLDGVGYAANTTGSGDYEDCYDYSGSC